MDNLPKTILIVEDDVELARWISEYLDSKGFSCITTTSGADAVALATTKKPDLILLDGMLPDLDGLDVCKNIRSSSEIPIVMLTARDEEVDEVLGLEAGADDYLVKPVRARALLSRINKFFNKESRHHTSFDSENPTSTQPDQLTFNNLVIYGSSRLVVLNETPVNLSSHEFDVLWFLASRSGRVVTREELVEGLRGFEFDGFDRSIDLRISRLRKKLEDDPRHPHRIKTIWGKGYLFANESR